jgi:enhancing lycopene biosynthesis protein 2
MFIAAKPNQDLFRSVRSETSTVPNHLLGRRAPTERRVLVDSARL